MSTKVTKQDSALDTTSRHYGSDGTNTIPNGATICTKSDDPTALDQHGQLVKQQSLLRRCGYAIMVCVADDNMSNQNYSAYMLMLCCVMSGNLGKQHHFSVTPPTLYSTVCRYVRVGRLSPSLLGAARGKS